MKIYPDKVKVKDTTKNVAQNSLTFFFFERIYTIFGNTSLILVQRVTKLLDMRRKRLKKRLCHRSRIWLNSLSRAL